jgi:hypothetical protein
MAKAVTKKAKVKSPKGKAARKPPLDQSLRRRAEAPLRKLSRALRRSCVAPPRPSPGSARGRRRPPAAADAVRSRQSVPPHPPRTMAPPWGTRQDRELAEHRQAAGDADDRAESAWPRIWASRTSARCASTRSSSTSSRRTPNVRAFCSPKACWKCCRTATASCARRASTTSPARKTFTCRRRRSAGLICRPAT